MYKKIYNGGSFGPGTTFNDNKLLFKNCTFQAACTFGDHCDFVDCTFIKCCPNNNTNQSTAGEHCRFFNCKLESIKIGKAAELYNTNKSGYLVNIQSALSNENKVDQRGPNTDVVSDSPEACGQRFNSKEFNVGETFQPCDGPNIEGYTSGRAYIRTSCK